jgi:hypothetical protein
MNIPDLEEFCKPFGGLGAMTPERWKEWDQLNKAWLREQEERVRAERERKEQERERARKGSGIRPEDAAAFASMDGKK